MDEKKEEMKEVEGFNFKLVLVNLVELVVLAIISYIVYSNIFVWFKSTSYIGSSSFWWVIALFLSVYGLIFIIKANVNNHIAASYVIARRGLKFKDYLLKQQKLLLDKTILTKYHWTQWFHFNKLVTN